MKNNFYYCSLLGSSLISSFSKPLLSLGKKSNPYFLPNIINKGVTIGIREAMEQKTEEYEDAMAQLQVEIDEAKEELESLEPNGRLSVEALTSVGSEWIVQETPSQFYARSTLTNPGVLSLGEIENYVNRSLSLPGITNFNSMEIV